MEPPEDQLHVIPDIHGAEPRIGLSEGHELVVVELVRLHGDRVERERLVDSKVCGENRPKEQASRFCWNISFGVPKMRRGNLR